MTDQKILDKESSASSTELNGFLSVVLTTFIAVFIAELGDKTQIATFLLSAHSGRPLIVFVGATLALVSTSLIGVLLGRWLASFIKPEKFEQIAGITMIILGISLGIKGFQDLLGYTSSL